MHSFIDHFQQATRLHLAGRLEEALEHYQAAARLEPGNASVQNNLGAALKALGRIDAAIACWERVVSLEPGLAMAHDNLGTALKAAGRLREAVACHRRSLALDPRAPDAWYNLGNALQSLNEIDQAMDAYRQAIAFRPEFPAAWHNLGATLRASGRTEEGLEAFQRAVALSPENPALHRALGTALRAAGRNADGTKALREAVRLDPNGAEALQALGSALQQDRQFDASLFYLARAATLRPDSLEALDALVWTQRVLCRWEGLEAAEGRLMELAEQRIAAGEPVRLAPFAALLLPFSPEALRDIARSWAEDVLKVRVEAEKAAAEPFSRPPDGVARPAGARLKLGYLSADFRDHAVSHLMGDLLALHDRSRFEVFAYSCGPNDGSELRNRAERQADHFADVWGDPGLTTARRILADGIDLLVDLTGYTAHSRSEALWLRPAPIQVNWLGYPGTLGSGLVDYLITDPYLTPLELAAGFSEQLVHMPHCYQINDGLQVIASSPITRGEYGLPEHGFVFACFNKAFKIGPEIFAVWMRLLQAVPGSVLWLLQDGQTMEDNLRMEAEARGVDPDRLVFAGRRSKEQHLARHRLADLALDTPVYNAHTTASDALWAGLPLVTCLGRPFQARVAGSILHTFGLDELIAPDLESYEATALRLARDPEALRQVRLRVEAARLSSPLFDTPRFVKQLEAAYLEMWRQHEAGEELRGFAVEAVKP